MVLADECTRLLHGEECLPKIKETAASVFAAGGGEGGGGGGGAGGGKLPRGEDLPRIYVSGEDLAGDGKPAIELFIELGMASSKGEEE